MRMLKRYMCPYLPAMLDLAAQCWTVRGRPRAPYFSRLARKRYTRAVFRATCRCKLIRRIRPGFALLGDESQFPSASTLYAVCEVLTVAVMKITKVFHGLLPGPPVGSGGLEETRLRLGLGLGLGGVGILSRIESVRVRRFQIPRVG